MPQETIETKAARLLKNGSVRFVAAGRIFNVKVGPTVHEVIVREDGKWQSWTCSCEYGRHNNPMHDPDHICYHVAAVVTFDGELMERIQARMGSQS